jgi:hypothetical protein
VRDGDWLRVAEADEDGDVAEVTLSVINAEDDEEREGSTVVEGPAENESDTDAVDVAVADATNDLLAIDDAFALAVIEVAADAEGLALALAQRRRRNLPFHVSGRKTFPLPSAYIERGKLFQPDAVTTAEVPSDEIRVTAAPCIC